MASGRPAIVDRLREATRELHAEIEDVSAVMEGGLARYVWFVAKQYGFLAPLETMRTRDMRAVILGAGGAARSVAVALASAGVRVAIAARRPEQAQAVAALTGASVVTWPPDPTSWDLLVNATPVGTTPRVDSSPLPEGYGYQRGGVVYDLVYNPAETRLLREARDAGCTTIGGLEMLVAQAQDQFEWWTGTRPAADVMRNAAVARLAEFRAHENHLV